jgi:hypothetical protein
VTSTFLSNLPARPPELFAGKAGWSGVFVSAHIATNFSLMAVTPVWSTLVPTTPRPPGPYCNAEDCATRLGVPLDGSVGIADTDDTATIWCCLSE